MLVACQTCGANFDVHESRLGPEGVLAQCPVCKSVMVAKAPPPGTILERRWDASNAQDDLPAPKGAALPNVELDLPAPKRPSDVIDLLAPVGVTDLPAPKRPSEVMDLPMPVGFTDLPAPKRPSEVMDLPQPVGVTDLPRPVGVTDLPRPVGVTDLPRPVGVTDLPRPVGPDLLQPVGAVDLPRPAGLPDLPRPVGASDFLRPVGAVDALRPVGAVDVVRPVEDDDGTTAGFGRRAGAGPRSFVGAVPGLDDLGDDTSVELPVPKGGRPMAGPGLPPVDESEPDLVKPKLRVPGPLDLHDDDSPGIGPDEALDLVDEPPPPSPTATADGQAEALPLEADRAPVPTLDGGERPLVGRRVRTPAEEEQDEEAQLRRRKKLIFGGAGAALVIVLAVIAGMVISDRAEKERGRTALAAARRLFADDTLRSYNKAADALALLVNREGIEREARALQVQAQMAAALLGKAAEIKNADAHLEELDRMPAPQEPETEVAKAKALRALADKKPADAEKQLQAVVGRAPRDAEVQLYLGWVLLASGDPTKAKGSFERALALEKSHAGALYGLGRVRELLGEPGAVDAYEKALKASPQHLGAALALDRLKPAGGDDERRVIELLEKRAGDAAPREVAEGWTLVGNRALDAGRISEAADRFQKALQIEPDRAEAKVGAARVLAASGKPGEAITALQAVVKAQPKNLEALLVLARAQLDASLPTGAAASLAAAEKLAPKLARTLYLKARLEDLRGGDGAVDRAVAAYREAIAADSRMIDAYAALWQLLQRVGKAADARQVMAEADKQSAGDLRMRVRLGEAYLAGGDAATAEKMFREVATREPALIAAQLRLGEALERQGRLDDAAAVYAELAKAQPKLPGLAERRADLARRQGKLDAAITLYLEALAVEAHPTPSLRVAAGEALLQRDRLDEARAQFEAAVKDDERSGGGYLGVARVALLQGHVEEAELPAKRASMFSDSPMAHLVYGRVHEAFGRLDDARREFELASRGEAELEARLGRSRLMVRRGAVKDALVELEVLLKGKGAEKAETWVLAGDCYDELSQRDKAVAAYENAIRRDPANAEAAFKLARELADRGELKTAASLLDQALERGGEKVAFAPQAYLLVGDLHRRLDERPAAIAAYRKYLQVAPTDAPERASARQSLFALGAPAGGDGNK